MNATGQLKEEEEGHLGEDRTTGRTRQDRTSGRRRRSTRGREIHTSHMVTHCRYLSHSSGAKARPEEWDRYQQCVTMLEVCVSPSSCASSSYSSCPVVFMALLPSAACVLMAVDEVIVTSMANSALVGMHADSLCPLSVQCHSFDIACCGCRIAN